ncbi:MAG: ribose 5-phosphate isomerase A [Thermoproteota archaeon]|nr:ribose 5-phosphate isomerase A [Thermoproteota archaeon]
MTSKSNDFQKSSPLLFEKSFEKIAQDVISNHLGDDSLLIGLGSGRAVSKIVNNLSESVVSRCEFICTSLQIKMDAEKKGLKILDETKIPYIDLVIDGADQIDNKFHLLKGGGGALLREKILYYASGKTIIVADSSKFVTVFSKSIPIEILPFGRNAVISLLKQLGTEPKLRVLDKGYPYMTENGNLILDTIPNRHEDVDTISLEKEINNIPGVLENGLFTMPPTVCYKALEDGAFQSFSTR